MHPFTERIALPEPIAGGSTELAEVLDQITTVGQALRLAGHLTSGKHSRTPFRCLARLIRGVNTWSRSLR